MINFSFLLEAKRIENSVLSTKVENLKDKFIIELKLIMARKKKTSWAEMTAVSSMSANWVLKNIGFVLFLGFIVLTYIANSRYAQKNIREIEILQTELKNQRRVYNALNAEVMNASKKEKIAEKVAPLGLKPSNVAPKKIVVESIGEYGKE